MISTQGYLGKFKVTGRKGTNLVSGSYVHIFLMNKTSEVLTLHKDCLWQWHGLIQGHSSKFKVTWRGSTKFMSGSCVSNKETLKVLTLHKDCMCPEGVQKS